MQKKCSFPSKKQLIPDKATWVPAQIKLLLTANTGVLVKDSLTRYNVPPLRALCSRGGILSRKYRSMRNQTEVVSDNLAYIYIL